MFKPPDLFLKVTDGVLVSIGEKVEDFVLYVILFQVVHQVGPVALKRQSDTDSEVSKKEPGWKTQASYLDLLVGCYGAKDDLRETLRREHPKADPSDHAAVFDE